MRRVYHENVLAILEELQGATHMPANAAALPTPGQPIKMAPGKGKPAQQVAAGAQQVAAGVQATAAQQAQTGDQQVLHQVATQQGIDPKQQQQVNQTLAAQPKPTKLNPTAAARGVQQDAAQNRQAGASGRPVQAVENVTTEEKVDDTSAGDDAANPDDRDGFNDNEAESRADQRAAEISPGAKAAKAAGYGKHGAGRGQAHHEVTHPGQRVTRSTEKDVAEAVLSDDERNAILDGVFG